MNRAQRRNAAIGWAVMTIVKRKLRRKPEPPARRWKRGVLAVAVAGAIGAGMFLWRRGGDGDGVVEEI